MSARDEVRGDAGPTVLGVLDAAVDLLRAAPRPIFAAALAVHLPLALVLLAVTALAGARLEALAAGQLQLLGVFQVLLAAVAAGLVLQAIGVATGAVLVARAAEGARSGRAPAPSALLQGARPVLPRAITFGAVSGVVLAALVLGPAAIVATVVGRVAPSPGHPEGVAGTLVALVLGGALVVLAGLAVAALLAVRFGLALPAIALEGLTGRAALARSRALGAGRGGLVLGVLASGVMIALALGGIAGLVAGAPSFEAATLAELRRLLPALVRAQLVSVGVGQLVAVPTHAFALTAWTELFLRLRAAR